MIKKKEMKNYQTVKLGIPLWQNLTVLLLSLLLFHSCRQSDQLDYSREMQLSSNYLAIGEHLVASMTKISSANDVTWSFGDGSSSKEKRAVYQYDEAGEYTVKLDVDGDQYQQTVKVEGAGLTRRIEELATMEEITIMAHRGNTGNMAIPENSIPAIEACIHAQTVDFIEIDLRRTKDGHIVLMHDADIVRTTTGAGPVAEYTLKELGQFNLKDRLGNATPHKIPTLKEALLAGRGEVFFDLDLGGRTDIPMTDIYRVLKETGMLDRVLIYTATNAKAGESLLVMDPHLHVYPYYSKNVAGVVDYMANYDRLFFCQIDSQFVLNDNHVTEMLEKGLLISVNMFDYNSQIQNNNFTGVQQVINASDDSISMMQTDYPNELYHYLKTINKK